MQIQNTPYKNNINFKARHIAVIKNKCNDIKNGLDLYELNIKHDKSFLKRLDKDIQIKDLMPNLKKQESERWQEMLSYAIIKAQEPNRKTYLLSNKNKPCGIITYLPGKNNYHLDCICTWPTEFGQKVKYAGKSLFNQLFNDFLNHKSKKIKLEAITDGPYNTVNKYKELGFIVTGSQNSNKILMEINTNNAKNTVNNLKNKLDVTLCNSDENINLSNILDF